MLDTLQCIIVFHVIWRSRETILNVRSNKCLVQINHYQKSFVDINIPLHL